MQKLILKALLGSFLMSSCASLYGDQSISFQPNKALIQEVQENFKNGEYDLFLGDLHAEYERAGKAGLLRGIFESIKKADPQESSSPKFASLGPEVRKVIAELDALKYHLPENATSTIENKISAILMEYHMKALLLEIAGIRSKSPSEERHKKMIALEYEKMEKLEGVVERFDSPIWKEKISKVRGLFDTYLMAKLEH